MSASWVKSRARGLDRRRREEVVGNGEDWVKALDQTSSPERDLRKFQLSRPSLGQGGATCTRGARKVPAHSLSTYQRKEQPKAFPPLLQQASLVFSCPALGSRCWMPSCHAEAALETHHHKMEPVWKLGSWFTMRVPALEAPPAGPAQSRRQLLPKLHTAEQSRH